MIPSINSEASMGLLWFLFPYPPKKLRMLVKISQYKTTPQRTHSLQYVNMEKNPHWAKTYSNTHSNEQEPIYKRCLRSFYFYREVLLYPSRDLKTLPTQTSVWKMLTPALLSAEEPLKQLCRDHTPLYTCY